MHNKVKAFLARNKELFGSNDGLPGDFHRRSIFKFVRPGKLAAYVTPQGNVVSGRVVMGFSTHAVLNCGGRHGTPGVVTPASCVYAENTQL